MSGLESLVDVVFRPRRQIGPIRAQVTIEENHTDDLTITKHPVETGADITDHAYKEPSEVTVRCGWSSSGLQTQGIDISAPYSVSDLQGTLRGNYLKEVYARLLALQESRQPFDILTGKRAYRNMLFKSLSVTTDQKSENVLLVTAVCQQIILVSTRTVTVPPRAVHAQPTMTAPVEDRGVRQPRTSALFNAFGG